LGFRRGEFMNVRLFNVSRVFQIGDTPTVVEPGPLISQVDTSGDLDVEIRRPDGTVTWATLSLSFQMPSSSGEPRRLSVFRKLKPTDVPVGSEIWLAAGRE
jgi:hypothetical protein